VSFVAAALTFAGAAQAQNASLELYGIIDAGVQSVSGVEGGRVTSLASGIMAGSRWGLRGSEDLGDGYRALFTLESRFEADTGLMGSRPLSGNQLPDRILRDIAPGVPLPPPLVAGLTAAVGSQIGVNLGNALFDRQAYLGLVTPYGAVLAGRQYTPGFEVTSKFDALNTDSFLTPGQLIALPTGIEIRTSNALQYRIQLGGFSASAMGALGEGGTLGRLWGLNAIYTGSAFSVGLGHNQRRTSDGEDALQSTTLGAWGDVGPVRLFGMVVRIREENPGIGPQLAAAGVPAFIIERFEQDAVLSHLGLQWPVGPGKLILVYNHLNDKMDIDADIDSYGAVYTYPLSKRTDINAIVGHYDNSATAQALPGGGGFIGGVTESAGTDSTGYAINIRHRF
jgi:predicted porin